MGTRIKVEEPAGFKSSHPDDQQRADDANGARPADDPDALLAGLRNGAWLDEQDFPPLQYHLPGIIPEGLTLLVGAPKIGKSWLVLTLALATSCGGKALGLDVDPRPTLYLALEDGDRRLQDRCRTLLGTDRIPPFDYVTDVRPGHVTATIHAWMQRHHGASPLVIVDTLGKVMPQALAGESAYQRDYRVGSALKRLVDSDPGAAVAVNHHDRKAASEDFVDRVSGTNGLAGSADTIVVLARARHETTGRLQVTGRDVAEGEYAVAFDGERGLWSLDGADLAAAAAKVVERRVTDGLDERSASIVGHVSEHPEGVTPAAIAIALGLDPGQTRTYLRRLEDAGRIARPTRGLYTPVTSVTSVTSEGA